MFSLKRILSVILLGCFLSFVFTNRAEAKAKLVAVFPLTATQQGLSGTSAVSVRQLLISRLSNLDGYDAIALDVPAGGNLGVAAAAAHAEIYITGQVALSAGGLQVTLMSFDTNGRFIKGYATSFRSFAKWPDQPDITSLVQANQQTNQVAQNISTSSSQNSNEGMRSNDLTMRPMNGWTEGQQGFYIIHERVELQAGAADVVVKPSDFVLMVTMMNGDRKPFYPPNTSVDPAGMIRPPEITPFGGYKLKRLVEASEDLNGLGSVRVPAHSSKTIVVTFTIANEFVAEPVIKQAEVTLK